MEFDLAEDIFGIEFYPDSAIGIEKIKDMIKECGYTAIEVISSFPPAKNIEEKVIFSIPESLKVHFEKAQEQKKFVLIKCSTLWCVACKRLHQEIENSREVKEFIHKNFIVINLEIENTDEKTIQWLQILGVPDSCIFSSQGKLLGRITGFRKASDYLLELSKFCLK